MADFPCMRIQRLKRVPGLYRSAYSHRWGFLKPVAGTTVEPEGRATKRRLPEQEGCSGKKATADVNKACARPGTMGARLRRQMTGRRPFSRIRFLRSRLVRLGRDRKIENAGFSHGIHDLDHLTMGDRFIGVDHDRGFFPIIQEIMESQFEFRDRATVFIEEDDRPYRRSSV